MNHHTTMRFLDWRKTLSYLDECSQTKESLAMGSFPMQAWCEPYDMTAALAAGTIFPCLNMEFYCAEDVDCSFCRSSEQKTTDQAAALNQISAVGFAINDLTLYLDTHPTCEHGLALFKQLLQQKMDLLAKYAKDFCPLTQISIVTGTPDTTEYGWSEGPLPWEGGHA